MKRFTKLPAADATAPHLGELSVSAIAGHQARRIDLLPLVAGAVAFGAVLLLLWEIAPNFYRTSNIINVLQQASILGLLAIGMTCVLITAGIDFSMPANMALSAILGAMVMRETGDAWLGPIVMLCVGTTLGAVNAFAVTKLRMVPFVVTLSTMTVVSGFSAWLTRADKCHRHPRNLCPGVSGATAGPARSRSGR